MLKPVSRGVWDDGNSISRRAFAGGSFAAGLLAQLPASLAQETPRRGGTLTATWGGGTQSCYVPTGGGYGPTFTSAKLLERLASATWTQSRHARESWKPSPDASSMELHLEMGYHDSPAARLPESCRPCCAWQPLQQLGPR